MRTFRLFLLLSILLIGNNTLKAAILTVDNNSYANGNAGMYFDLQTAVDSAMAGDTLLIQGSSTAYTTVNISKNVVLIGPGYNPHLGNKERAVVDIILKNGASNTFIAGLSIQSISTSVGVTLSGITFLGCEFQSSGLVLSGIMSNILIANCIIENISGSGANTTNVVITNNIIKGKIQGFNQSSIIVRNNLFYAPSGNGLANCQNVTFENNIFYGSSPYHAAVSNCTFNNNISYLCADPTIPYGTNTGTGNLSNTDPQFVNVPNLNFDYSYNFRLGSGSPAKNAGTDAKDIGLTGGVYPIYVSSPLLTGEPPVPYISSVNIANTNIPMNGGTLLMTIKVKKHLALASTPNVTAIQYFFDLDSGVTYGRIFSFTPADSAIYKIQADITGLSLGQHTVFIRTKNTQNVWGLYNAYNFNLTSASCPPVSLGKDITACPSEPVLLKTGLGSSVNYLWSNSSTDSSITVSTAGTFTVKVFFPNGCIVKDTIQVNRYNPITISLTPLNSACNQKTGSIVSNVAGDAPFSYLWSTGDTTPNLNNLSAGYYTLHVTDNHSCSNFASATVNNTSAPVITADIITPVRCFGGNSGAISINITGGTVPYTYEWSNGALTKNVANLYSGTYTVSVTDSMGCSSFKDFTVTQPDALNVTKTITKASCGTNDGSISLVPTGGTSPYTYLWSNSATSATISSLAAGYYSVKVIDDNLCSVTEHYSVDNVNGPEVIIDSIVHSSCKSNKGSIYISLPNISGQFSYLWSDMSSNQDLTNVSPGTYSVEVTDLNSGCKTVVVATINSYRYLPKPQICMVTVEPYTGKNMIVWERYQNQNIAYYNIYKETTLKGVFVKIGSRPFDSISSFIDYASNPRQKSESYAITSVDSCNNESEMSPYHKTLHLATNKVVAGENNLIWNHYEGTPFLQYKIYRGTTPANMTLLDSVSSNINSYTDLTPPAGVAYYQVNCVFPNICSPAIKRGSNTAGPFSQSFSNLKDYTQTSTLYMTAFPGSVNLNADSGSFEYANLFTNSLEWDASENIDWINIQKSFINSYVKVIAGSANLSGTARVDSFKISTPGVGDKYIIVNQAATSGIFEKTNNFDLKVYPNPFTQVINVEYTINQPADVIIEMYDLMGKPLFSHYQPREMAGSHNFSQSFDSDQGTGIYFVRLQINDQVIIRKLVRIK